MSLIRRLKWKNESGVETEYDLGAKASNVVQDTTHRFVTDAEKAAWNAKQESGGDTKTNVITFTAAAARQNIQSGETQGTIMGKIHKFFADLQAVAFSGSYTDLSNKPTIPGGAAASYAVANNDTTTAAGYVADARIVRTHGLEIDQISSDLNKVNVYVGSDNKLHFVNRSGADSALPFSAGGGALFFAGILTTNGDASQTLVYDPDVYTVTGVQTYIVKKAGTLSVMICEQWQQTFRFEVKVNGTAVAQGNPDWGVAYKNVATVKVGDTIYIGGTPGTNGARGGIALFITTGSMS